MPKLCSMLGHLRPYVKWLKRLLAWPFLKLGMTPTQIGIFGIVGAVASALLFRTGFHEAAFWVALVAVSTDMADGEVARSTRTESPQGNYLDAVGDRLRECILLLGLMPLGPELVSFALVGTCMTSFAKARCALVMVMDTSDWPGLGVHADRAVMLLLCYRLAPDHWWPLALLGAMTWSCFVVRARAAVRKIEKAEPESFLPYLRI